MTVYDILKDGFIQWSKIFERMSRTGLEPALPKEQRPQRCAYTNSATATNFYLQYFMYALALFNSPAPLRYSGLIRSKALSSLRLPQLDLIERHRDIHIMHRIILKNTQMVNSWFQSKYFLSIIYLHKF